MTRTVCWLALSVVLFACAAHPKAADSAEQERPLPAAGLEIRYAIDAARPPTRFRLAIPPTGDAELVLLESLAEARCPLGRFRGPVSAETRRALERYVRDERLLDAEPGESATAEGSGTISLATPEKRVRIGLASSDPARNGLRSQLDTIVAELSHHPVAAVEARVRGEQSSSGFVPVVELAHVGSEPIELVMVEGDLVASIVASLKTDGRAAREIVLGGADMRALVHSGQLRTGITRLAPGERIAFRLRATVEPPAHVSVRFSCWFPGIGKSRSQLQLNADADLR